ncbi:MAG TPA: Asp-tRNA(Asn)/Glu-tRNA(Gln) amidotransferase subunit GatC [Candidatus Aphodousia faecavium]|uniref:Aspartyl/glutamyl-tRNA(Asn/Gln) amidotransferase subunit C n=1 Tax=Parasutterella secunda TaxID=626947 RepID=A0ABS2GS04_9BURK|nr:Asp-tRNA(Asn)/Glu-tRNA(Gln) amidotransferase subunit GatC [Parasutterella secunda]MBM6927744.1 Asp-tRNA(Asn)/Glu-tRNA(Gln) amidotransferase subunit GatC [Parasutterella secunda]HIT96604.1 Asp-tRNA(Asn)/Glu-tRNA(Gln) amidotransferase subunit GatC [Candidatus Aphodousia faecavium]
MTLALEDIRRIANLGHLELNDQEAERMQGELNNIFKMIERIQAVDTEGVEPMPHPHDGSQRLRDDIVREVNDRENNMKNAPEQAEGHFLVPQVIE